MDTQPLDTLADIPVNPAVLVWARKIRGLSMEAAALRLEIPVSELQDYESRRRLPNLGMLQRMSTKYKVNYAALFMPEPLADAAIKPITDFRLHHDGLHRLSVETHAIIADITSTLETLADLKEAAPSLFGRGHLDTTANPIHSDPVELAKIQRAKFQVTREDQIEKWRTLPTARDAWRREIETHGVFVYFRPLGPECSGLTVQHDGLFAICVNERHGNTASRIFTLFHEYCHVLRRQTGVSDENYTNPVERFCNQFSAAFLIPATSLAIRLGEASEPRDFSMRQVTILANLFKVSISAMALRLESLGYGKKGLFDYVDRIVKSTPRPEIDPTKRPKIDPVQRQAKRLGQRHTKIAFAALDKGIINTADARSLLGLEPSRFDALRSAFE